MNDRSENTRETTTGSSAASPPVVLIVDDDPVIRSTLSTFVKELGFAAAEAENGLSALAQARRALPDLILLDVEMPLMDGRETLTRLKEDPALRAVPVIVISGMEQMAVAVHCIEGGAEDYLTKPFSPALLRARIQSSLEKARLRAREEAYRQQMERYGLELEERVREKTRDLAEAHARLRILDEAKDDFLRLISHELRTPMTGVMGAGEAFTEWELDEATRREATDILRLSIQRVMRIVDHALLLTQIKVSDGAFVLAPRPIGPIVAAAVKRASTQAASPAPRIEQQGQGEGAVLCDHDLLVEALGSLLECALKFSLPDRVVHLAWARVDDQVQVSIRASGYGIPSDVIPRFFDVLSIGNPITPGGDLGLGPAVAAQVLRLLGGSVSVESPGEGVCFVVNVRAADATSPTTRADVG